MIAHKARKSKTGYPTQAFQTLQPSTTCRSEGSEGRLCWQDIDGLVVRAYAVLHLVVRHWGVTTMAAGVTTSIRMPEEVRDLYETIAQATGRTKNDLMVEVLTHGRSAPSPGDRHDSGGAWKQALSASRNWKALPEAVRRAGTLRVRTKDR